MWWVVYNVRTIEILGKFYSKKEAKEWVKGKPQYVSRVDLALDLVDVAQLDKWKMWKTLQIRSL